MSSSKSSTDVLILNKRQFCTEGADFSLGRTIQSTIIMKKLFIILLSALSLTAFADEVKMALLQPLTVPGSTECNPMEISMVRGELRKAFGWQSDFQVLTRMDVDAMLKEQGFQRSGMVDDGQRKQVGIMTGAQYICVSSITKYNTQIYIEAYLVDIETGQTTNPASQYINVKNEDYSTLPTACGELAKEMLGEIGGNENKTFKITNKSKQTEEFVISKRLLQERGFRFPNRQQEAIATLKTSRGNINITCATESASELNNAWCYGTNSDEDCYINGLALFKCTDGTWILGYIACGSMAYPYMDFRNSGDHFFVGIQEIKCSYGCAYHPKWDSSDTRRHCPYMQKIFGKNITTVDFIKAITNNQIYLPDLQKSFELFLKKGGSIDSQWCDDEY